MSDFTYDQLHEIATGRKQMITCPAHDDQTPSLHVSLGDDDKIVLKCFAGCPVVDVLNAWDLCWSDLFPPSLRNSKRSSSLHVSPDPLPVPAPVNGGRRETPEIRLLLDEWKEGKRTPKPVRAPKPPRDAPPLARDIYDDMLARWGLRLGAEMPETRALPYTTTEAVRVGLCAHSTQASRAMRWLVENGLIWRDEEARDANGTRMRIACWLPGPRPSVDALPSVSRHVEADRGLGLRAEEAEQLDYEVSVPEAVALDGREVLEPDD